AVLNATAKFEWSTYNARSADVRAAKASILSKLSRGDSLGIAANVSGMAKHDAEEIIATVTNGRGHKVRLQKRRGAWDVLYNSAGISWTYKKKGVSEQEARAEFDL